MQKPFVCIPRISRSCLKLFQSSHRSNCRAVQTHLLHSQPGTRRYSTKMAATEAAANALAEKLTALSVTYPLPEYPNCHPEVNPVDIYRAHLTTILTEVTGVDAKIVYPALQWTSTLEMGDLLLPVPALRVKGKKPQELALEWVEKVP